MSADSVYLLVAYLFFFNQQLKNRGMWHFGMLCLCSFITIKALLGEFIKLNIGTLFAEH